MLYSIRSEEGKERQAKEGRRKGGQRKVEMGGREGRGGHGG